MKKIFAFFLALFLSLGASAFDKAVIRIKKLDGQTLEKNIAFEKSADGFFRITIPVGEIGRTLNI